MPDITPPRRRLRVEQLEDRVTPTAVVAPGYVEGRVLVTLNNPSVLTSISQSPLVTGVQGLGYTDYQLNLAAGVSVESALAALGATSGVTTIEPDYPLHRALIPNDPQYASQLWGMNNTGQDGGLVDADIDAPEGWDIARGTGRTVVGVIDDGIDYNHPDLYRNIWINEAEIPTAIRNALTDIPEPPSGTPDGLITFHDLNNPVNIGAGKIQDWNNNGRIDGGDLLDNRSGWEFDGDNDQNGYADDLIGWDFANHDNNPFEQNDGDFHGTHVAGTIGATGNNNVGVTGVAWRTRMASLKFFGPFGGSTSGAIAAVNYSRVTGMKVTNNSWGGGAASTILFNAINNFRVSGGIFVAAAGNSAYNNDLLPNYPSNYNLDNIIAVAATTRTDTLSNFSQYGAASVDIGAPGTDIRSTWPTYLIPSLGSPFGYDTISGTSMATPHVAGVAAVVWDANPTLPYAQVIFRILSTARPIAALAGKTVTGGVVNLEAALSVTNPPPPPGDTIGPRVTVSAFSGAAAGSFNKVRFTFNETVAASSFTVDDVIALTGPDGAITPTGVTPVSGTEFDVTFADQATPGAYSALIGPDITDPTGNPMNQDGDFINGEIPADQYTSFGNIAGGRSNFTTTAPAPIRDLTTTSVPIVVPITQTIADLDVQFNITHTWDSDLQIYLRAPNGTQITLVNRRGANGDNFTDTWLDDEAAEAIGNGVAPFAGSFRPEGLLSTFDNLVANGKWQFRVYDASRSDTGRVNSVTLSFLFNASGSSFRFTASTTGEPPVIELLAPATRVGGDFVPPRVATERPPLVTPTAGKRYDATAVTLAPLAEPEETGSITVVAGKPLWITELWDEPVDEFAPIEV